MAIDLPKSGVSTEDAETIIRFLQQERSNGSDSVSFDDIVDGERTLAAILAGEPPSAAEERRRRKLDQLVALEGYPNLDELLRDASFDSLCPGICMSERCDYSVEVEPDQKEGWCECCCDNTVASALVLAGVI